jgi:hypothetical protein
MSERRFQHGASSENEALRISLAKAHSLACEANGRIQRALDALAFEADTEGVRAARAALEGRK